MHNANLVYVSASLRLLSGLGHWRQPSREPAPTSLAPEGAKCVLSEKVCLSCMNTRPSGLRPTEIRFFLGIWGPSEWCEF